MKNNYKRNKILIDKLFNFADSEVFDYEFSPENDVYSKYFDFCQTYLNSNFTKLKIQPAFFYYRKYDELNAAAFKKNDTNFIAISKFLFHILNEKLNKSNELFKTEKLVGKYFELKRIIPFELEKLIFQSTTLFIFHHEFGHIIQGSEMKEFDFKENLMNSIDEEFNINSHLREYDADLNGAQFTCFHTIEYFEDLQDEHSLSPETIHKLLAISLSGIMIYRLMFLYNGMVKLPKNNPIGFYLKKNTHPHPIVRIAYIIQHFAQAFETNTNISVDENHLYNLTIEIADSFFEESNYVQFIDTYHENKADIDVYINELNALAENDESLVRNKHTLT